MKKLFTYLLTSVIAVTAAVGSMPVIPVVYAEELVGEPLSEETPAVPDSPGVENPMVTLDKPSSEDEGLPTADETESLEENEPFDESGFFTPSDTGTESEETVVDEESEKTPSDPDSPGDKNPMVTPDTSSSQEFFIQNFEETCNGVGVSIEGLLPEGVSVSVCEVSSEEIQDRVNEDGLVLTVLRSFDISLFLDGEEYEPSDDGNSLIVRFTNLSGDIEDTEAVTVIHTTDEGETSVVGEIVEVSEDAVAFAAADFSVYSIGVMTVEGSYTVPIVGRDGDIYHMYLSHDGATSEAFCLDIGKSAHNGDTYNLVGRYTENREVRNVVQCYSVLNANGNPYAPTYAEAQVLVWAAMEGHMSEAEVYEILCSVDDSGHDDDTRIALAAFLGTDSSTYQSYYLLGSTYLWTNSLGSEADGYQRFVSTVGADAGSAEFTVRFVDYDDSEISTHTYNSGDTVVTPPAPLREHFTFAGWNPAVEPICTADATYKATYTADPEDQIRYVIHFVREDGSLAGYFSGNMDDLSFEEGDGTVLPESGFSTTLSNAWFLGWKPVLSSGSYIYPAGTAADVLIENGYMEGDDTVKECTLKATYVTSGHNKGTLVNYWDMDYKDINGGKGELIESLFFPYTAKIAPPHRYRQTESVATAKFYTDIERTNEYTFGELDPDAANPAHEIDLFKEDTARFRVVFRDYDNSIISTNTYRRGETVTVPADPTRASTFYGSYTFSGWTPEVSATCTGDATYVATYDEDPTDYTVVFISEESCLEDIAKWGSKGIYDIKTDYHYGDEIVYPSDPMLLKPNGEYTFTGWNLVYSSIYQNYLDTGNLYTATYSEPPSKTYEKIEMKYANNDTSVDCVINKVFAFVAGFSEDPYTYKRLWLNDDEQTVLMEESGKLSGMAGEVLPLNSEGPDPSGFTTTKMDTAAYDYQFSGWDKTLDIYKAWQDWVRAGSDTSKPITSKYFAQYSRTARTFTVKFVDQGNVISSKTYHYGDEIEIPADPVKPTTSEHTYTFNGWTPLVSRRCVGNATYVSTYTTGDRHYSVKFMDADNVTQLGVLKSDYIYDSVIENEPDRPQKADDNTYTYYFSGWTSSADGQAYAYGELPPVTEDCIYTAHYLPVYRTYAVRFVSEGEVVDAKGYHYGDEITTPADPVKAEDKDYTYTFSGWMPAVQGYCTGDATYTAVFTKEKKTGNKEDPEPKDDTDPTDDPEPPGDENPDVPSDDPTNPDPPGEEPDTPVVPNPPKDDPKPPVDPDPARGENPVPAPDIPSPEDTDIRDDSGFFTPSEPDRGAEVLVDVGCTAASTPSGPDTEPKEESKKVPLMPIIGGFIVTGIIGGVLVVTGAIDYLWTALLWLLFAKRRIKFHGILTDEKNPFIRISAGDDEACELCSDYLEKSGTLTEYIEYVKGCGSVTTLPYKTQMSLSYLDGSEVVTNEYDADEEKLFELLDEMDAMNVDVHIFNNRAHFDIPLTFDFTKK